MSKIVLVLIICFSIMIFLIYLYGVKFVFNYLARKDRFCEADFLGLDLFPTKTFLVSLFWIISMPILLINDFIKWIFRHIKRSIINSYTEGYFAKNSEEYERRKVWDWRRF